MSRFEYTMGKTLDLKKEQEKTLQTPVLKPNFILKLMYLQMDLLYGRKRTLIKFKVIEILARYPYFAWENAAYHKITRDYARTKFTEKPGSDEQVRLIEMGRKDQDNEQWHLMLIEDIMKQKNMKQGYIKARFLPRMMAWGYYHLTRAMYRFKPAWSFLMNAKFESHAEHEYMKLVQEHPEWETEPVDTPTFQYYPRQKTMADLFRRIGLDERDHMNESIEEYEKLTGKTLS